MENTLENKEKFFALYTGQQIFHSEHNVWGFKLSDCPPNTLWKDETIYAQLKLLSSITDEDAYGTGILVNCWSNRERGMDFFESDEMKEVHIGGGKNFALCIGKEYGHGLSHPFANSTTDILAAYDWLRSKGYALPFMGLSVEKMIEYNWIKLTL
jgi:hypothetical protein